MDKEIAGVTAGELSNEVLNTLEEYAPPPQVQEGDITMETLMELWHCKRNTAERQIGQAVKDGKFTMVKKINAVGKSVNVYVPTEKG